jgi:hypothetical protein
MYRGQVRVEAVTEAKFVEDMKEFTLDHLLNTKTGW